MPSNLTPDELAELRAELLVVRKELTEDVQRLMVATGELTNLVVLLLRALR